MVNYMSIKGTKYIRDVFKTALVILLFLSCISLSTMVLAGFGSADKTGERTKAHVEAYIDPSGDYISSYGRVDALDGNWVAMRLKMEWWYYPNNDGPYSMEAAVRQQVWADGDLYFDASPYKKIDYVVAKVYGYYYDFAPPNLDVKVSTWAKSDLS